MAKFANVFSEIKAIARQQISELERQGQAAKRIDQFKIDLALANLHEVVTQGLYFRLLENLRAASKNAKLPNDIRNVFVRAFSQLTGEEA